MRLANSDAPQRAHEKTGVLAPALPSLMADPGGTALEEQLGSRAVGVNTRMMQHDDERHRPQEEPDEAPETPTDEPTPAPVQDPPAEPDRAPYVVHAQ
jgi:hypothetical protein